MNIGSETGFCIQKFQELKLTSSPTLWHTTKQILC